MTYVHYLATIIFFMISSFYFFRMWFYSSHLRLSESVISNSFKYKHINRNILKGKSGMKNLDDPIMLQKEVETSIMSYNGTGGSKRRLHTKKWSDFHKIKKITFSILWIIYNIFWAYKINLEIKPVDHESYYVIFSIPLIFIVVYYFPINKFQYLKSIRLMFKQFPAYSTYQVLRLENLEFQNLFPLYCIYPAVSEQVENYYHNKLMEEYKININSLSKENEKKIITRYLLLNNTIIKSYLIMYITYVIWNGIFYFGGLR